MPLISVVLYAGCLCVYHIHGSIGPSNHPFYLSTHLPIYLSNGTYLARRPTYLPALLTHPPIYLPIYLPARPTRLLRLDDPKFASTTFWYVSKYVGKLVSSPSLDHPDR